ncbi:hypothetical protein GCM10009682_03950 [Luedemannella flava]|uniref:Uncharacterized protein n=1 Tax=Luedemannella flava TaxID=349316 RepID=A0ABN2LE51_9ACTN
MPTSTFIGVRPLLYTVTDSVLPTASPLTTSRVGLTVIEKSADDEPRARATAPLPDVVISTQRIVAIRATTGPGD